MTFVAALCSTSQPGFQDCWGGPYNRQIARGKRFSPVRSASLLSSSPLLHPC